MAVRTLLIKDNDGEFKVTLPDGAHVTFGPDVPFAKGNAYAERETRAYSLRVYADKGKTDLVACFAGVRWFRDASLPHARLVVREAGKSMWKSDEHGYEVQTSVARDEGFVDTVRLLNEGDGK